MTKYFFQLILLSGLISGLPNSALAIESKMSSPPPLRYRIPKAMAPIWNYYGVCEYCEGIGRVKNGDYERQKMGSKDTLMCPACKGKKRQDEVIKGAFGYNFGVKVPIPAHPTVTPEGYIEIKVDSPRVTYRDFTNYWIYVDPKNSEIIRVKASRDGSSGDSQAELDTTIALLEGKYQSNISLYPTLAPWLSNPHQQKMTPMVDLVTFIPKKSRIPNQSLHFQQDKIKYESRVYSTCKVMVNRDVKILMTIDAWDNQLTIDYQDTARMLKAREEKDPTVTLKNQDAEAL